MKDFFVGFIRRYIVAVAIFAASAMVLVNSSYAAEAVRRGIEMCLESVIPSLFPMIFLSQFMIKSGAAEEIGVLLKRPTEAIFGLPGVCGAALLTAMIGGFPAGARAAETLTSSRLITRRQGQRMAMCAFCSGPGFTIGLVGAVLYGNKTVGALILTAQIISSIIIGTALNIFGGKEFSVGECSEVKEQKSMSEAFVESASDAASTVLAMSSFVVIFCVISEMISISGINEFSAELLGRFGSYELGKCILPCLIEVTNGSILSVKLGIPFTAFVVGFGGLSVHFQNFAICRKLSINKALYIAVRFVQGIICSLITGLVLKLPWFDGATAEVFAHAEQGRMALSRNSVGFGMILLIMCLMSVLCLPNGKTYSIDFSKGAKASE